MVVKTPFGDLNPTLECLDLNPVLAYPSILECALQETADDDSGTLDLVPMIKT